MAPASRTGLEHTRAGGESMFQHLSGETVPYGDMFLLEHGETPLCLITKIEPFLIRCSSLPEGSASKISVCLACTEKRIIESRRETKFM